MSGSILSIFGNFFKKYFPLIVVFLLALYMPADTDLGWHLKYGEYFAKTGTILRENILSLEMQNYTWTNASWITDAVTYTLYSKFGFMGIAVAGAFVSVLIFYLIDKSVKLSFWEKGFVFPLIFFLMEPLIRVSFRGQLVSILFTSVLIYILCEFQKGKRKAFLFLLPLFLIWANSHGGFLIGLAILTLFYASRLVKLLFLKKTADLGTEIKYLPVVALSYMSALINPFGFDIYKEVFKHFGNPYQKFIIEWIPLPPFSDLWWLLIFWGIFLIVNVRLIISKEKFSDYLEWVFIVSVFYFLSHWMRRYAWTMYLISVPIASFYFKETKPARDNFWSKGVPFAILFVIYLYSLLYHIPAQRLKSMSWERFCREFIKCSPKSAEFLIKNNYKGKFMSNYNWGGWLIWNYPDIKPSIDGRMHLWRDEKGYSAFAKYYFLEQNVSDIDESDYDVVYASVEKPIYLRLLYLTKQEKWEMVYKDDMAGIFVRTSSERTDTTRESE